MSSDTSTLTESRGPETEPAEPERTGRSRRADVPIAVLVVQPLVVLAAVVAVVVYVATADLSSTESVQLTLGNLWSLTLAHIKLTVVTGVIVIGVAVSLGILVTRPWARPARSLMEYEAPAPWRRCTPPSRNSSAAACTSIRCDAYSTSLALSLRAARATALVPTEPNRLE